MDAICKLGLSSRKLFVNFVCRKFKLVKEEKLHGIKNIHTAFSQPYFIVLLNILANSCPIS